MTAKVTLIGRIGTIEIREHEENKFATLSVAVDDSYKTKTGDKVERTNWFNIEVKRSATADFVSKFVTKGTLVFVEGNLGIREYTDSEGKLKKVTEISVAAPGSNITILSKPAEEKNQNAA